MQSVDDIQLKTMMVTLVDASTSVTIIVLSWISSTDCTNGSVTLLEELSLRFSGIQGISKPMESGLSNWIVIVSL